jgi:trans-2,3-dihydro-3-hydroxyanthranilate isomerase
VPAAPAAPGDALAPPPAGAIVNACLRDGRGGSPTAVLPESGLTDAERRAVPARLGTSHAVFVAAEIAPDGEIHAALRFFTTAGELPACGHGTVAALAYLADLHGIDGRRVMLRAAGRAAFEGHVAAHPSGCEAVFAPGPVEIHDPGEADWGAIVRALRIPGSGPGGGTGPGAGRAASTATEPVDPQPHHRPRLAALGRPRLLVPVADRAVLAALAPDLDELRAACDRLGLLGCYVHTVPTPEGHAAARMFAPSIGVPEDIANANSTACLAARMAADGMHAIAVDMGDSLGSPATVTAGTRRGPDGRPSVHVGGVAAVDRLIPL